MFGKHAGYTSREVKIEDLSLDFVNRETELLGEGTALNLSTRRLLSKIERENLKPEEFNFFV